MYGNRKNPGICAQQNSVADSAYLPPLTEGDFRSILFGLKANNSRGHDGIYIKVLSRNFYHIKAFLLSFLKHIILSGVIPLQLKKAIVFPSFKSGARNKIENYRPISGLSCIGQILGKHMLNVMTGFLWTHDVFFTSQYGFIVGRGTQTLLEGLSDLLDYIRTEPDCMWAISRCQ